MIYLILISVFWLLIIVFKSLSLFAKDENNKVIFSIIGSILGILEGVVLVAGHRSGIVIAAGVVLVVLGFIDGIWGD